MTTAVREARFATLPHLAAGFKPSIPIRARYDNWIGGEYAAPFRGQYFVNPTPVTGQPLCEVARSTQEDVDRALDAAHAAAISWNGTSPTYRANILNRIADRIEANIETLAFIETLDNGKPIRETHRGRPAAGGGSLPLLCRLHPGPGRRDCPSWTRTPSPTTSTSRSASLPRSSPGTSRS